MDNDLKSKLRDIIPLDSGASFKLLWDMLYHIRLLKYVRQPQLKEINPRYSKICSEKKLKDFEKLSLLKKIDYVYIATDNVIPILKEYGYNTKLLPKIITGNGSINELNNTSVFIQALQLPDFKALLYPYFDYVIPDALLVRQNGNKYKLEFLEVEASKPNWNDWLENKRINYLKLASDYKAYSYWKAQANYLDLPVSDIKDFKFSVSVIGKIKMDFGNGFNFVESL